MYVLKKNITDSETTAWNMWAEKDWSLLLRRQHHGGPAHTLRSSVHERGRDAPGRVVRDAGHEAARPPASLLLPVPHQTGRCRVQWAGADYKALHSRSVSGGGRVVGRGGLVVFRGDAQKNGGQRGESRRSGREEESAGE